eukprot:SAG31_NODE_5472_length_2519_cov_2.051653_1_plen_302_part_00
MAARGTRPKVGAPNYGHIGDKHLLQKKVPVNPQYANVQAKLDTGARWRDDVTFTRPKRKNEFFGRVTADLLVQILDENEEDEESLYNLAGEQPGRSVVHDASATGLDTGFLPYLLLDMREADYYDDFHIKSAAHFPATMLSRSTNCFTPQILGYINHPTNIIVIYHADEKEGIRVAATMAEKNVENVYLLSGGLKNFTVKYSSYISGDVPDGYASVAPTAGSSRMGTGMSSRAGTSRMGGTSASRSQMGTASTRAGRSNMGGAGHYGGPNPMGGSRRPPGSPSGSVTSTSTVDRIRAGGRR